MLVSTKIKPQNKLLRCFFELYLDPLQSASQICSMLSISMSKFYRLERELSVPKMNVGLGRLGARPLVQNAIGRLSSVEKYDLEVLRSLGHFMQCRIKIVCDDHHKIVHNFLNRGLSFALASVATTPERSQKFSFSHGYLPQISPHGAIYGDLDRNLSIIKNKVLGIVSDSIHECFDSQLINSQYRVLKFASHGCLIDSLLKKNIHAAVMYSGFAAVLKRRDLKIKRLSRFQFYSSQTSIPINKSVPYLEETINRALEQMAASGQLDKIYRRSFITWEKEK